MRILYYITIPTAMIYFGGLVYLLATNRVPSPMLFAIITPFSLGGFITALIELSKEKQ